MNKIVRDETFVSLEMFSRKKKALLFKAIEHQDCDRIRKLFTARKGKNEDEIGLEDWDTKRWNHELSAPQYAYQLGREQELMTMLECGVDPAESQYYMKTSLLEDLIRNGDSEMIEKIIPYVEGIDEVHIFDQNTYQIKTTYLGLCAALGNVESAKILMKAGALMKPWSMETALERDEDCPGAYTGAINVKRFDQSSYYAPWKELLLEPWQFAVLCGNPDIASWFFEQGSRCVSCGFGELILHIHEPAMIDKIKELYPEQIEFVLRKENIGNILETSNAELLRRYGEEDMDILSLGKRHVGEEKILRCYDVLKARLPRELSLKEKRHLVYLMLKLRSERLIGICEQEWEKEKEACDISDWASLIPTYGPTDRAFVNELERSNLRLAIHPEHDIFDERHYYFEPESGLMVDVHCLDHMKNLAILNRLVEVIPPDEEGQLLPFTMKVLHLGKKTAYDRLVKWGLINEKNMAKVSDYIVENNLDQYYDQAIKSGESKGNQKNYAL